VIVKLDVDTLPTEPDDPPAAGPDRALDPPPPAARLPDALCPVVAEGDVAGAEGDVAQPAVSPTTAHISAAATARSLFLFDSNRPTLGRRACVARGTETDESGENAGGGGGSAPVPPELPAADGPDVALNTE
jgi:hypothetical protein